MEKLKLSFEQINKLKIIHKQLKDKKLAYKINVIILLNAGYSYEEVQEVLLLDERTIRRYEEIFLKEGIEGLSENKYQGRMPKLDTNQEKELKEHLEEKCYSTAKEIKIYIKEKYDIDFTRDGLVITLHRLGFNYKKTKIIPGKADNEKQKRFVEEYKELKKKLNTKNQTIYFIDGVHPTHNVKPSYAWIKVGTDKYIKSNTGRERVNLNGAYNPISNTVEIREDKSINSNSTIELFKTLEEKHKDLEEIHIICDNARYYYSKAVMEYVSKTRIKLHFLPSYSPNLNLIERLWKFFKKKIMNNKYYEKIGDFRTAIKDFFKNIEEHKEELKKLMNENFHIFEAG